MKKLTFLLLACLLVSMYSCNDNEGSEKPKPPQSEVHYMQRISYKDLISMDTFLKGFLSVFTGQLNIDVNLDSLDLKERIDFVNKKGFREDSMYVNVYKISYQEQNPNPSISNKINNSGVLIVPSKSLLSDNKSCKLVVISPGAYSDNKEAPSMVYKNIESLTNQAEPVNQFTSYFHNLLATEGFAILIPDYPGFGDSFKECIHPLLGAKPMTNSLVNLISIAQDKIAELNYTQKGGIILSGYSLGGYVSGLAGKEIDQNNKQIKLDLLFIGGAVTDLLYLSQEVKKDHATIEHLVFPWAVLAYKNSGYPNLNTDDIIIKSQQESITKYLMTGELSATDIISLNILPAKSSDFYTTDFRASLEDKSLEPKYKYLNQVLAENSFTAWRNKVEFKMLHAENDITAYYAPAKKLAADVNKMGGNVSFETTKGDHMVGAVFFYQRLLEYSLKYK